MSCCNKTKTPFHIPGYSGNVQGHFETVGKTFASGTHEVLKTNVIGIRKKGCNKNCMSIDPCGDHNRELRARLHMLQGEIDPNPCQGTEWNLRNQHCVKRPKNICMPKLRKLNQHGYLSRLSCYEKNSEDPTGISACRAGNTFPCKGVAPSQRPFWKEYEDMTNVDLFQEYSPECRHLPLPKLKPKAETCWDEDFYLPVECYDDFQKHGYIRPPAKCECLPLDARKDDKDIKYYRHETDPNKLILPYFADPKNEMRYFVKGYTGHVPTMKFRFGETRKVATRNALNMFTNHYMTPHLKAKCPVWIDPHQYCEPEDPFGKYCTKRKTYDGHLHEKPIRDRLKSEFNPKDCLYLNENNPLPLGIQSNLPGNVMHNPWFGEKKVACVGPYTNGC